MKFRCEREVLADALSAAGRAATSRTGTLPVLSGLRLEVIGDQLSVTGTDLELSIRLTVTVGGERDGAVVVPARLVADIVRSLPAGAVEVALGDDEVSISAGRSQFLIRPLGLDDYPVLGEPATEAVTLTSDSVAEALRQVVRAASTDDARAVLTGVLITAEEDGVRMVATDSYRLAVRDLPDSDMLASGQKVLVPSRALNELQRVLGHAEQLQVRLGARDAVFEAGGTRLTTRLIEGEYPNYRNLLPSSYPNTLTVGRDALLESLRRVKILAQDATPVRLRLGGDTLQLTRDHPGRRQRDRGDRRQLRRHRDDGRVQPGLPRRRCRRGGRRGGHAVDHGSDEAGRHPRVGRDDYLYLLMPVRVP